MHPLRNFLHTHKVFAISIGFLVAFSFAVVHATPPTSPYTAGATLDPQCAPGASNCTVSASPWTVGIGANDLYSGDVNVHIGTFAEAGAAYAAGAGSQLTFDSPGRNTDALALYRYNVSPDVSSLRINLGDNGTTPGQADYLDIGDTFGTWQSTMVVKSDGLVGINNTNPQSALDVTGNLHVSGTITCGSGCGGSAPTLQTNSATNVTQSKLNLVAGTGVTLVDDGNGNITISSTGGGSSSQWDDVTDGINYAGGNVGIGNTTPSTSLDVNGTITGNDLNITGTPIDGPAAPTNVQGIIDYQSSEDYDGTHQYTADGSDTNYKVYAYKIVDGTRVYSSTYSTLSSDIVDDNSGNYYNITLSWDASAGADGYRIIDSDGGAYDEGYDTTGTSIVDGDGSFSFGSDSSDIVVTPSVFYTNSNNINGGLNINGTSPATITTVADPTNLQSTFLDDPTDSLGYNYIADGSHTQINYRVYAYKDIDGNDNNRIYSSGYTTLSSDISDDDSGDEYAVSLTWDAVSGADGYRVIFSDGDNYDEGYDTTTNSLIDDDCGNDVGTCPSGDDTTVTPTSNTVYSNVNAVTGGLSVDSLDVSGATTLSGTLIATGTETGTSEIPNLGGSTRMEWIPSASAFRVGTVYDNEWDSQNVGEYSVAFGTQTIASGDNSSAFGGNTTASGTISTAFGQETVAEGSVATAFGEDSQAEGDYSTAFGSQSVASGEISTAFGQGTTANGEESTAFGTQTQAQGLADTAFGANTVASGEESTAFGQYSNASADLATAFGYSTTASATDATAFGDDTTASGSASMASGYLTVASGDYSTAFGDDTTAFGQESAAFGLDTTASSFDSTSFGTYNVDGGTNPTGWTSTDPLFEIGNGTDSGDLSDAFEVLKNGDTGINMANPTQALEVNGNIKIDGTGDGLYFPDGSFMSTATGGTGVGTSSTTDITFAADSDDNGSGVISFATAGDGRMTIANDGDVGIGTNTPQYLLDLGNADIDADGSASFAGGNATIDSSGDLYIAGSLTCGGSCGGGSSITLETNGSTNASQSVLNLFAGSGITLTANGSGKVTIAASGGGGGGSSQWTTFGDGIQYGENSLLGGTNDGVIVGGANTFFDGNFDGFLSGSANDIRSGDFDSAFVGGELNSLYNTSGNTAFNTTVFGQDNTVNISSGNNFGVFVAGYDNTVSGNYATAIGYGGSATGDQSFADGGTAAGTGSASFGGDAEGDNSFAAMGGTANGEYSIALGFGTTASDYASVAIGVNTTAAFAATALGVHTTASGEWATTIGDNTTASGIVSTASGYSTVASGDYSVAFGDTTTASSYTSTSFGQFNVDGGTDPSNWVGTDPLFEVGNGTDPTQGGTVSDALVILKNGNTGIGLAAGTDDPAYLLQVGSSAATGTVARFQNSSGTCDIDPTTSSLTCSSDMNLKKNITNLSDNSPWSFNNDISPASGSVLDEVLALNPVQYNWKTEADGTTKHDGFIAQEVQQVFPGLVATDPTTGLLSLNYTGLIPYTVAAIQEMNMNITGIDTMSTSNTWRDALITWLGDSMNGITSIFSQQVVTPTLCVGTNDDKTCITKIELDQLLQNQTGSTGGGSSVSSGGSDVGSGNPSGDTTGSDTNGDGASDGTQSQDVTPPVVTPPVSDASTDQSVSDDSSNASTSTDSSSDAPSSDSSSD